MTPLVDAIKDKIRAAKTIDDVNAVAMTHRHDVASLRQSKDPDLRTMAIQIANLANLRRIEIESDTLEDGQKSLF